MKPWKVTRPRGACVGLLACALVAVPATARADDNSVTLTRYQVPSHAVVDQLNNMGADLAENVTAGPNGTEYVDIGATPDQQAVYEAMGAKPVQVLEDEQTAQAIKAERDQAIAEQSDAMANLKADRDVKSVKGAAAAADTVQAQRADYFENYAGRFISIEGWTSDGAGTPSNGYTGPALTASVLDAQGNTVRTGTLSAFVDDGYYQYHTNLFRLGEVGDGGTMPSTVRVASANGGVDTIAVKQWVSNSGSGQYPNGFLKDFNTHYVDPQEAMAKIQALNAEFPNISSIVKLPNKTPGYQRLSQAIVGTATPYNPMMTSLTSAGSVASADQPKAVVVTSKLMGQNGGNNESITITNPNGAVSQALSVTVSGNDITVNPATDATGAITSTAAQVIAAINGNAAASALVTAVPYRTNTAAGVVSPTAKTMLSDFLKAPASYPRGPQQPYMLRIGKDQSGAKTGVFIYCQEHAREWATPLVCLETAERLLRNYGTDPETTNLVNNLDIFIVPVINMDGAAYSMYDFTQQRKNMVDYCPQANSDPTSRNQWGVDLNRNFSVGSFFDGYDGGSGSCTSDVFSGPSELSEPEDRNETYIQSTYTNIKFAMNIHSYGGYFMWPPGAYQDAGRVTLPYPSYGTLSYFQQTADSVLDRIKSYRGTAILPSRTGPVADVLYSAAGNSADEAYYNHGIIGYDFEVGADRFVDTTLSVASTAGATGIRAASRTPFQVGDKITIDPGSATQETATVTAISNPASPAPNLTLAAPLQFAHAAGVTLHGGTGQSAVNFQPPYATEGHEEGMEFSNGNYALLDAALAYENDKTAPTVTPVGPSISATPFDVTLNSSEAADIYYTTDGSTPTTNSTHYQPSRPRGLPTPIHIGGTTTLRWLAKDFAGNTSTGSQTFTIGTQQNGGVSGTVPATLALTLGTPASFSPFVAGSAKDYTASTTANVISSAGDGTLSVSDPSSTATGHLVNGTFSLPSPLQVMGSSAAGTGTAFAPVGGSAAPTTILTYTGPTSNDTVTVGFKQSIGANDALRTGTYSKTLTFTLSTTTP